MGFVIVVKSTCESAEKVRFLLALVKREKRIVRWCSSARLLRPDGCHSAKAEAEVRLRSACREQDRKRRRVGCAALLG